MLSLKDFKSSKFQMFEKSQLSDLTNIIGGTPMSSTRDHNGLVAGDVAGTNSGGEWDDVVWYTQEDREINRYVFP